VRRKVRQAKRAGVWPSHGVRQAEDLPELCT
jgi:hypothetical protein